MFTSPIPPTRRDELARERGFISYSEQRRYDRIVRNRAELDRLPDAAKLARADALNAISIVRREGVTLKEAAWLSLTTPQAIAYWAPGVVTRDGASWVVSAADRMYRPMFVYSDGQRRNIDVRGSRVASTIGRYHAAVGHYLATGDSSRIERFAGMRVAGVELETELEVLEQLARRGVFEFESIYQLVL